MEVVVMVVVVVVVVFPVAVKARPSRSNSWTHVIAVYLIPNSFL